MVISKDRLLSVSKSQGTCFLLCNLIDLSTRNCLISELIQVRINGLRGLIVSVIRNLGVTPFKVSIFCLLFWIRSESISAGVVHPCLLQCWLPDLRTCKLFNVNALVTNLLTHSHHLLLHLAQSYKQWLDLRGNVGALLNLSWLFFFYVLILCNYSIQSRH